MGRTARRLNSKGATSLVTGSSPYILWDAVCRSDPVQSVPAGNGDLGLHACRSKPAAAHRLEHEHGENGGQEIHRDDQLEHRHPGPRRFMQQGGERAAHHSKPRQRPNRGSRNSRWRVRCRTCRSGSRGRGRKSRPSQRTPRRTAARTASRHRASAADGDGRPFDGEGEEHGVFTANAVRHPAEKRAGQPIGNTVDRQGQGQRRQAEDQGVARPQSREKAPNWEMTIRPELAIIVIITNISQKIGVRSIWPEV